MRRWPASDERERRQEIRRILDRVHANGYHLGGEEERYSD
jgi:hypothetical protein